MWSRGHVKITGWDAACYVFFFRWGRRRSSVGRNRGCHNFLTLLQNISESSQLSSLKVSTMLSMTQFTLFWTMCVVLGRIVSFTHHWLLTACVHFNMYTHPSTYCLYIFMTNKRKYNYQRHTQSGVDYAQAGLGCSLGAPCLQGPQIGLIIFNYLNELQRRKKPLPLLAHKKRMGQ